MGVAAGKGRQKKSPAADSGRSCWNDDIAVERAGNWKDNTVSIKNFTGGQWALLIARFRVAFFFRL